MVILLATCGMSPTAYLAVMLRLPNTSHGTSGVSGMMLERRWKLHAAELKIYNRLA